jgi:tripartite-type tricarboxylate transporter receptor subunit TctC
MAVSIRRPSDPHRRTLLAGAAALGAAGITGRLRAQPAGWPTRPISIVSPYNPGGTNDIPPRFLAEGAQKLLGQNLLIQNRPGAAGIVGSQAVMNAAPDGYTLLSTNNGAMIVQAVVKSPAPYDPLKQFTPIVRMVTGANFVGVSADLGVSTVGELIALMKRRPGELNYSSAGSGSFGNFLGEYFKLLAGVDMVHVPGRGSASAVIEMKAGRIQVMFDPLVLPQSSDGRIKVLATLARERLETHPQIPTIREAGGPEMVLDGWFGLFGPAGLPAEIVERLETTVRSVYAEPETRRKLLDLGLVPDGMGAQAFRAKIEQDLKVYADIRTRAKLVVE